MENLAEIILPSSLRMVAPFLEEAQTNFRLYGEHAPKKVVIFCIDHALRLITSFAMAMDEEGEAVIQAFRRRRNDIAQALGHPLTNPEDNIIPLKVNTTTVSGGTEGDKPAGESGSGGNDYAAEDILIMEATSTLALAEEQKGEGEWEAAARNFHIATIYFRVLESMVPRLTSRVHSYLGLASRYDKLFLFLHLNLSSIPSSHNLHFTNLILSLSIFTQIFFTDQSNTRMFVAQ